MKVNLILRADHDMVGGASDGFLYLINTVPRVERRFKWLKVTEVFTAIPPSQIAWPVWAGNGIPVQPPVDCDESRRGLRRGHTLRSNRGWPLIT